MEDIKMGNIEFKWIEGGVTAPQRFMASGIHAGLKKKPGRKDLGLIHSLISAVGAGVYTKNLYAAAPVVWCRELDGGATRTIVINSGNANAGTGSEGMDNCRKMADAAAAALGLQKEQVFVCSTGVIGVQLPIEKILDGIPKTVAALGRDGSSDCAAAIMTTDTFIKETAAEYRRGDQVIRIGGIAKGSGMIHPDMATMLGFITTDAQIEVTALQSALRAAADDTFNMITVDGDTSTNDTLLILANGAAKNEPIVEGSEDFACFTAVLREVCLYLAKSIARDGEGATKLLQIEVDGAKTDADAKKAAKAIASSSLVKTAFFGEDANWGRIICAAGYSGADFDINKVRIELRSNLGSVEVMRGGAGLVFDEVMAKQVLSAKEIVAAVRLGEDAGRAVAWGCDLTYDYVKINGSYRS